MNRPIIMKNIFRARTSILILLLINTSSISYSAVQEKRNIKAVRTTENIQINGSLDEGSWRIAAIATNFIIYSPYNGVASGHRTEVRVLYDDNACERGKHQFNQGSPQG